jgi:hypothetical protein
MPDHFEQIIAPTGDWFRIQIERADIPEKRTFLTMTRVVAWAIMSNQPPSLDEISERFEGINADGYPHLEDDYGVQYEYVHGDDIAPNGKTWRAVFNETPSSSWGHKDISAFADILDPEAKLDLKK